jgi:uncharacterized spore protein YtfJ
MTAVTGKADVTETPRDRREISQAETLERTLNQAMASVRSDAVFGRPVEKGPTTVIPCTDIMVGMGMGGGRGQGKATEEVTEGEGLGGGAGGHGRPIAVIVLGAEGVRVKPVVDVTRLALAALTTAGFMAFWLGRLTASTRETRGSNASLSKLTKALRN